MSHQNAKPPTAPPSSPGTPREHLDYLLTAYAFENLSAAGRAEVERHLAECAVCRDQLAELRATVALAEAALDDGGREYVFDKQRKDRVLKAASARQWRGWNYLNLNRFSWKIAAVAAMLMVCVLLFVSVYMGPQLGRAREAASRYPEGTDFSGGTELVYKGNKDFGDRIDPKAPEPEGKKEDSLRPDGRFAITTADMDANFIREKGEVSEKVVEESKKLSDKPDVSNGFTHYGDYKIEINKREIAPEAPPPESTPSKSAISIRGGADLPTPIAAPKKADRDAELKMQSELTQATNESALRTKERRGVNVDGDDEKAQNEISNSLRPFAAAPIAEAKPSAPTTPAVPTPADLPVAGVVFSSGEQQNVAKGKISGYREAPARQPQPAPAEFKDEPYQVMVKPPVGDAPAVYESRTRRIITKPSSSTFEKMPAPSDYKGGAGGGGAPVDKKDVAIAAKDDSIRADQQATQNAEYERNFTVRNAQKALSDKDERGAVLKNLSAATGKSDPSSREQPVIALPEDMLKKAELSDHFETVNVDKPVAQKSPGTEYDHNYRLERKREDVNGKDGKDSASAFSAADDPRGGRDFGAIARQKEAAQQSIEGGNHFGKPSPPAARMPEPATMEKIPVQFETRIRRDADGKETTYQVAVKPVSSISQAPARPNAKLELQASPPADGPATANNQSHSFSKAGAGTLQLNGGILNSDNGGTVILNGVNAYSGTTTIGAGTLSLGTASSAATLKGVKSNDESESEVIRLRGIVKTPQGAPAQDQSGKLSVGGLVQAWDTRDGPQPGPASGRADKLAETGVEFEKDEKAQKFNYNLGSLNDQSVLKELEKRKADVNRIKDFPGPAFEPQAAQQLQQAAESAKDMLLFSGHGNGRGVNGLFPAGGGPGIIPPPPDDTNRAYLYRQEGEKSRPILLLKPRLDPNFPAPVTLAPDNKITPLEIRDSEKLARQSRELDRQLAEQNAAIVDRDAVLKRVETISTEKDGITAIDDSTSLGRDGTRYRWFSEKLDSAKQIQGVDSSFFSNASGVVSLKQKEDGESKGGDVDSLKSLSDRRKQLEEAEKKNRREIEIANWSTAKEDPESRKVAEESLNKIRGEIEKVDEGISEIGRKEASDRSLAGRSRESEQFKMRIGKLIEHAIALNDSGDKKAAEQMATKILMIDPLNTTAGQIRSEARGSDYAQLFKRGVENEYELTVADGTTLQYPQNWDMISRRQDVTFGKKPELGVGYEGQITTRSGDIRLDGVYLEMPGASGNSATLKYDDESKLRAFSHFRASNSRLTLPEFIRHPEPVPPAPLTDEGMDEDAYIEKYGTRPFVDCARDHLSTFGMDVDTAAYTRTRALLREGKLPAADTVRVEEFVNYFKQNYVVEGDEAFGVFAEAADSPFIDPTLEGGAASKATRQLLRVGIKSREARPNERKPATLTFVVDMSGSMNRRASNNVATTRMELVKQALTTLVAALNPDDAVTIIGFSEQAELVLPRTQARQRQRILDGIESMQANGSTNVESGLLLGLRIADEAFASDSINRMVLISDGMANVGANGPDDLLKTVRSFAQRGVDLSTVGVGLGKLNDEMLRKFADAGNGACHFADTVDEAKKILLEKLPPHLNVLARDAKVQVDFDPQVVKSYRLLGYEKRKIADKDFRNDAVNAGEVAHNTLVTALYEIVRQPGAHGSMGKVFLRWKDAGYAHQPVVERNYPLSEGIEMGPASKASPDFRFLACVARFAELLRDSKWTRHGSYAEVLNELDRLPNAFKSKNDWKEVYELVTKARDLSVSQWKRDLGI